MATTATATTTRGVAKLEKGVSASVRGRKGNRHCFEEAYESFGHAMQQQQQQQQVGKRKAEDLSCPINTNPLAYKEGITVEIGVDRVEELSSQLELLRDVRASVSAFDTYDCVTLWGCFFGCGPNCTFKDQ
ncbi:hypothetical protein VitviT2T_014979 [Vitis vinifera]|uniref:Uncharacterized protein n=1 Tax=Vitis vinifera TaxID=29760 RepID=A0ABY9CP46_VITVI|nr:hypothetical protein VitviT2T_014979 [Vitis vinifera]